MGATSSDCSNAIRNQVESISAKCRTVKWKKTLLEKHIGELQAKFSDLEGEKYVAISRVHDCMQILEEASLQKDQALLREKQKEEDIEKMTQVIAKITQEAAMRTRKEVENDKNLCNVQISRLTDDLSALQMECGEKQSLIERTLREKRAAEEELEKVYQEGWGNEGDYRKQDELQQRCLIAERSKYDLNISQGQCQSTKEEATEALQYVSNEVKLRACHKVHRYFRLRLNKIRSIVQFQRRWSDLRRLHPQLLRELQEEIIRRATSFVLAQTSQTNREKSKLENVEEVRLGLQIISSKNALLVPAVVSFGAQSAPVSAFLDSGTAGNFLDLDLAHSLGIPIIKLKSPITVCGLDGGPLPAEPQQDPAKQKVSLRCQQQLYVVKLQEQCLSQLMVFFLVFVSSIFCGHLGKIELDSITLAAAVINVTGISIGLGMASACDTLMSQTYGGKNVKRVGTILQRGILILMLCCFPCWAIFINTEQMLLLFKQNPHVARLTQRYVIIFSLALPAVFLQQLQTKYLQNQGIMWPQFFVGLIVNVVNAVVNAILLYGLKLGVDGSAWANTISHWAMFLLLFSYIVVKKLHVETWGGWSKDCLQEWGTYLNLAIPSMLMLCIEWWTLEIAGFLAGLISVVELGAQAVIMELTILATMPPLGFSIAATVRIGNALGARDVEQAKKSYKVALCCTAFAALLVSSVLLALKNVIGYIFTKDKQIIALVSHVMILFAPFHLCDAVDFACGGILRGIGKPKIGAIINVVGYYLIGLPIGISLMFLVKLGIIGLWTGLLFPVVLQSFIYVPYIIRSNWNQICEEASIRAGIKHQQVLETNTLGEEMCSTGFGLAENENIKSPVTGAVILPDVISSDNDTNQFVLGNDPSLEASIVVLRSALLLPIDNTKDDNQRCMLYKLKVLDKQENYSSSFIPSKFLKSPPQSNTKRTGPDWD
ncbi:uncharacterized protein LOC142139875 [Mixophyes fleayi]|uniref:uncharacterized protein LOC142139875 n=1 Tax=Mixophyes fleayi TaxID=3061075 RepID=UPI003F4DD847